MLILLQRKWIVHLAQGSSTRLSTLNQRIRQLDLLGKTLAPILVGVLVDVLTPLYATLFTASTTALALVVELVLLRVLRRTCPDLDCHAASATIELTPISTSSPQHDTTPSPRTRPWKRMWQYWLVFYRQPIFLSCLAMGMLYTTVLAFGGSMLAFLTVRQVSSVLLAIARSAAVVAGVLATLLVPMAIRKIGLVRTGAWALWQEAVSLVLCLLALTVCVLPRCSLADSNAVMMVGVAVSRFGLWGFDLVQMQLLQERVSESDVGVVNGVNASLIAAFDLAQYAITLIWSDPAAFRIPTAISVAMVWAAATVYAIFLRRERGHLFPFHRKIH